MPSLDIAMMVLAGIPLFAAFVNGAIGYGFSSLTVPLALVFYTNRILNPAVVVVEVFINFYVLFINFATYVGILPLILLQAAGWRRPIRSTWLIGLPFGGALGVLYSVTPIS